MHDSSPIYSSPGPSIGLVVGTFAAVPYVHLQLESRRRHYPHIPLLVNDDGSPMGDELRELCGRYDAACISNSHRLRQTVGDLSAYVNGFDWAASLGLDILVKFSRRFIPLHDWSKGLQDLAFESQLPTFSQSCDHFNFGFRTECIGFHCQSWRASGAYERVREQVARNEPIFVEGFLHQLARQTAAESACEASREYVRRHPRPPDRDGYAAWNLMPARRTTRRADLLWHDADGPFDYARAAAAMGLGYVERDFEDANQALGVGPA
ncbi:MAG TPA: hypothetical protein VG269_21050 [Tepidisphaeraceae bacterium]|jgi:hypothetical protein|nr:hypothetical protein [Tepidisphaeraceae bacterium]